MGRQAVRSLLATLLLALACSCFAPPAHAGAEDEAQRQADFARNELKDGDYDRALKSAESALRLDPALYGALMLKALAYEGLGDLELAESLLLAFREMAGLPELPEDAARSLARIQAALAGRRQEHAARRRGRVARVGAAEAAEVEVAPLDLDPEPYRERSQLALRGGKCSAALAAAMELTRADAGEPDGHRLLGDAYRCSRAFRPAVLAYRRYLELGGTDPNVQELLEQLATSLASVDVSLVVEDPDVVPLVQLELDGERIDPVSRDRTSARFQDLGTTTAGQLVVAGRGLRAEVVDLEPLGSGESRSIEVSPEVVGLGTVALGSFDGGTTTVTVYTPDEAVGMKPGAERVITAGDFEVGVETALGGVRIPLHVDPGGRTSFEPSRHLPAGLTLAGLPAGAEVLVFVENPSGATSEYTLRIPSERGQIDEGSGLRLVAETRVDSLIGGKGGVFVGHPQLGESNLEVVLENGAWTGVAFDATAMPGAAAIGSAWQAWQEGSVVRSGALRRTSGALAVISGILLGGGGALVGLSQFAARQRIKPALVCDAWTAQDGSYAGPACVEAASLQRQQDALVTVGSAALSVGLAGVSVSIAFGAQAAQVEGGEGEWDPWDSD